MDNEAVKVMSPSNQDHRYELFHPRKIYFAETIQSILRTIQLIIYPTFCDSNVVE